MSAATLIMLPRNLGRRMMAGQTCSAAGMAVAAAVGAAGALSWSLWALLALLAAPS